jgi:hypothetical protein
MRFNQRSEGAKDTSRLGVTLLALAFLLVPLLLLSCYPGEITNIEELDTVGTVYDPNVDYSQYNTYVMPDSVEVIDERDNPGTTPPISDALQALMLQTIEDRLADLGYSRLDSTQVAMADVGVAVGIILSDELYVSIGYPGWGCGWYDPFWPCWGYYPPVSTAYRYESGTVFIDMLDFATAASDTVSVVWQAGLNGLASSKSSVNEDRIVKGINQAFSQSPYLESAGPGGP